MATVASDVLDRPRTGEAARDAAVSAPAGGAVDPDAYGLVALPVLTHLIRYKWLYAVGIAWVMVLVLVHPQGGTGSQQLASARSASARRANGTPAAKPATKPATAPATPKTAAVATGATSAAFSSSSDSSTFATADSGSMGPQSSSSFEYTPPPDSSSSGSDSGSSSGAAPPPPSCTTDSTLPVPVATTVVSGIGTAQTGVTGASGQAPPADPAATVGSAAGCNGSSGTSSSQSQDNSALFTPEAFNVLLTRAMTASF